MSTSRVLKAIVNSVNKLVEQWSGCTWGNVDKLVPRVTSHRSKLRFWITGPKSHLIKKLKKIKRKPNRSLAKLLKIKKLEIKIPKSSEADLAQFEAKVFEGDSLVGLKSI